MVTPAPVPCGVPTAWTRTLSVGTTTWTSLESKTTPPSLALVSPEELHPGCIPRATDPGIPLSRLLPSAWGLTSTLCWHLHSQGSPPSTCEVSVSREASEGHLDLVNPSGE